MAIHLKYGGSTFARTLNCPAWIKLTEDLPPSPVTSPAAEEGTGLHEIMENMLRKHSAIMPGKAALKLPIPGMVTSNGVKLTEDMLNDKLIPARDALYDLFIKYSIARFAVEPFVELIPGEAGGSIDVLGVSKDGKTLVIIDYKFGYNKVEAENNAQMLFYALCACVDPQFADGLRGITRVVMAVIQPTADPVVSEWIVDPKVLDDFELEAYAAIDKANASDGTDANIGEWCRFCPAAAMCKSNVIEAQRALRLKTEQAEQLSEALKVANQLEHWIAAVRKMGHEQLEQGVEIPGFKLVNKRASRVWANEADIEDKVKRSRKLKFEETHVSKLLSPAQMEKLFKSKGLDPKELVDYISNVSSGTTMVPDSDKRPAALSVEALAARAKTLLD